MTPEARDSLNPFREEALKRDIPDIDVEQWISAAARPCVLLSPEGDGPVVGRFGGSLMLPREIPDPRYPFLASVDCAALPGDATDLPLPTDGQLLVFAYASDGGGAEVLYVPSGADVRERAENHKFMYDDPELQEEVRKTLEQYPQGPLHLTVNVSLPSGVDEEYPGLAREHPYADELCEVWRETHYHIPNGSLQVGGYPTDENGGYCFPSRPAEQEHVEDWILLADWYSGITGVENCYAVSGDWGIVVHMPILLSDLTALRLGRVHSTVFWNPA